MHHRETGGRKWTSTIFRDRETFGVTLLCRIEQTQSKRFEFERATTPENCNAALLRPRASKIVALTCSAQDVSRHSDPGSE
jgi:hypothetical protein